MISNRIGTLSQENSEENPNLAFSRSVVNISYAKWEDSFLLNLLLFQPQVIQSGKAHSLLEHASW